MKINSPLPQPLPKECAKAAKIFKSFVDSSNNGLDGVIPRPVLEQAKGFAIFTIFKAGFLFSARAGTGIVIAKLDDGSWSAPSAIGTAGVGVGGQAGAEMTDFIIVLNSKSAVRSFMAAGSLTLGGNMSIAVGPLGRNGEASGSVNSSGKLAAMYSYSKTRGLFGGVSLEGSVIVERQDANASAYRSDVTAKRLLSGNVDTPSWARPLVQTIESCTGMPGNRQWIEDGASDGGYVFGGAGSPVSGTPVLKKKKPKFPPATWGEVKDDGSYFNSSSDISSDPFSGDLSPQTTFKSSSSSTSKFGTQFQSDFPSESSQTRHFRAYSQYRPPSTYDSDVSSLTAHTRSMSLASPASQPYSSYSSPSPSNPFGANSAMSETVSQSTAAPYIAPKPALTRPLLPGEGVARAIALFDFRAVESGDLSFSKGDIIIITKKSGSSDDWWTGKLNGRAGIFPANFVEVV